jgi:hypothetical protein
VETRVVRVVIASFASFLLCPTFISTAAGADCVVACMERSGCWSGGSVHEPQRCNNMPELCNIQCRNQNRDSWGAIAYSVKDKGFGYSDGWPDLTRAKNTGVGQLLQARDGVPVMDVVQPRVRRPRGGR